MTRIEHSSPPVAAPSPARGGRRLSLIGLGVLVLVLVVLSGAGYAGYQAGLAQRDTQARATQAADLEHQYELAQGDMAAGRYEVAQARLEYILQLDPHFRDTGQQLAQVRGAMVVTPTPTHAAATAAPSPLPTATPSHEAADLFAQAQSQSAAGDWDGAISTLNRLHAVDPSFQPVKASGLLYVAYRNRGVALISGKDIESGMFDLDKAEAIGPLDREALNYRAWGRLYLAAQSFWGLDWRQAMLILQQLHLIAPYFHDTSSLLYTATLNYADQLAKSGDPCGAVQHYTEAQALKPDPKVAESLAAAEAACAKAPTAVPEATASAEAAASARPGTPATAVIKSTPAH